MKVLASATAGFRETGVRAEAHAGTGAVSWVIYRDRGTLAAARTVGIGEPDREGGQLRLALGEILRRVRP